MNRTVKLYRSVKRPSGDWGTKPVPDKQLKKPQRRARERREVLPFLLRRHSRLHALSFNSHRRVQSHLRVFVRRRGEREPIASVNRFPPTTGPVIRNMVHVF